MPPDRARTINSRGRQKSCSQCAKGKRKCSLGQPKCLRCAKQRLPCTYPPQPSGTPPAAEGGIDDASEEFGIPNATLDDDYLGGDVLPSEFGLPSLLADFGTDQIDFDMSAGITSLDTLSNMLCDASKAEDQMAVGLLQTPENTFSHAHLEPSARSRVEWSIKQLKLAPKMMVEHNGTPWQHAMLYQNHMPRHLQDAYATCALFNSRNGTNDHMIVKFIRERVRELMASAISYHPTELLARAHALILYQIMLVFDGDVRLYSQAELLLPLMDEVGTALLSISVQQVDPFGVLPFYPSTAAHAAWTAYMFRESLRRTVLSIYLFITLCHLLRGTTAPCSTFLAHGNKVTLSAQLWNAKSAFDYAVAWNNEKHFLVNNLDFTEVMDVAEPKDIDAFGKMIMIGLQGEDDIKGWLYTKGGTL